MLTTIQGWIRKHPGKTLPLAIAALALSGCGGSNNAAPVVQAETNVLHGIFTETACVYNGPISEANGEDIYSTDSVTLNADGTGGQKFKLYTDSKCKDLLTTGSVAFTYSFVARYGSIDVIRMTQADTDEPGHSESFYITSFTVSNGYYFDVDGKKSDAGPYSTMPTASDVATFQANPTVKGVFFQQQ
jgi:hypothetical protein